MPYFIVAALLPPYFNCAFDTFSCDCIIIPPCKQGCDKLVQNKVVQHLEAGHPGTAQGSCCNYYKAELH